MSKDPFFTITTEIGRTKTIQLVNNQNDQNNDDNMEIDMFQQKWEITNVLFFIGISKVMRFLKLNWHKHVCKQQWKKKKKYYNLNRL